MEVKFDLVRIGGIRKSYNAETILKGNVDLLRNNIRSLLKDLNISTKQNSISIVMIIPGKGDNIKIALDNIKDDHIRKELRHNLPRSIYKGDYSLIMNNIDNRIF
jgi:hypothetical protein